MSDSIKFWKTDPWVIFDPDSLKEFVPTGKMSLNRKLNALTRFLIYFSLLLFVIYGKVESILFLVLGLGIIYLIYDYKIDINVNKREIEGFSQEEINDKVYSNNSQNSQNIFNNQVDQIIDTIQGDSLLPSGMFDANTIEKHRTNGMKFRYTSEDSKGPDMESNYNQSQIQKEPQGAPERSNNIPDEFAPVDAVKNAFTQASKTHPFQQQMGSDCGSCSTSPYNLPTCDKGTPSAMGNNDKMCQMPTGNNPYMNVLNTDYGNNPNKLPACNQSRNETDNAFSQNLFRNVDDVWDRNNGQMGYNTQPSTTIPNDRDAFQKWLYKVPYVCKDGDLGACYRGAELQQGNMRPGKIF